MTDSDELLTDNVITFNDKTSVSSFRGPSFRDRVMMMSSTMQLPRNFDNSRYAHSHYEQRSMYRRETSPMSVMSACDMRQRNYNNSYYPGPSMSSQRSVYNSRSRSPMSVRSVDSSVSTTNIVMELRNNVFKRGELDVILKEVYKQYKFNKPRVSKPIYKRHKSRMKSKWRKYGYDSGELSSDSSLSSDDRSQKSSFKENRSCRTSKTSIVSELRRNIKDSNMYRDCTENIRQDSFRNKVGPIINDKSSISYNNRAELTQTMNRDNTEDRNNVPYLKDRFKSNFLLPSQRFNKSSATSLIHGNSCVSNNQQNINKKNRRHCETDSEQDEIFTPVKDNGQVYNQRKRTIESTDDILLPGSKRNKVASPCKNNIEILKARKEAAFNNNEKEGDFVFAKPVMPVRKPAKEILLATSRAPLMDTIAKADQHPKETSPQKELPQIIINHTESDEPEKETNKVNDQSETTQTDLSMRPSFIKRKLYTQRLDIAENKNLSITESSPQGSMYSAIQKEKHKARKLVNSQSCMSHDIQDDSNLLDLIHKIVPANSINITKQNKKTDTQNSKKSVETEKWDATSTTSTNINDKCSETFTDEDIFNDINDTVMAKQAKSSAMNTNNNQPLTNNVTEKQLKVLVDKLPIENSKKITEISAKNGIDRNKVQKSIKSFLDTDSESDFECRNRKSNLNSGKNKVSELLNGSNQHLNSIRTMSHNGISSMFSKANQTKLSTTLVNTTNTTQRLKSTYKIKSHREPKLKELKTMKSYFETNKTLRLDTHNDSDISIVYEDPKIVNKSISNGSNKKQEEKVPDTKSQNKRQANELKLPQKNKTAKQAKEENKVNNKNTKLSTPKAVKKNTPVKLQESKPSEKKTTKRTKTNDNSEKSTRNLKNGKETLLKKINELSPVRKVTKNTQIKKDITQNENTNPKNKTDLKNIKSKNFSPDKKTKTNKSDKSLDEVIINKSMDSTLETNNNKSIRPVRSCRLSKLSNSSIISYTSNGSDRSLRPRKKCDYGKLFA